MSLAKRKILLTGGSGGIGSRVGELLLDRGASLVTISRSGVGAAGGRHFSADLSTSEGLRSALAIAADEEPDVLISLAGVQYFGPAEQQSEDHIEATYAINLVAPALLCRAVLPAMKRKRNGQIVNVGSILGSIALAYFATYSSSKAGLRSFSEALRRELAGTGIAVTYIAPRAARTGLITRKLAEYADLTGMAIDDPDLVASRIVNVIERRGEEVYFGNAERFFVKMNGVMPRLVDFFLAGNDRKASAIFSPPNSSSEGTAS